MKDYDKEKPLISLHIPKCGGQSLYRVLYSWFGKENFYEHYYDETRDEPPPKHNLSKGICIHGHFVRTLKFGVMDYYPTVNQFITIIRDPYEMVISFYFYRKKIGTVFGEKDSRSVEAAYPTITKFINAYLNDYDPFILNNMPYNMTIENYEEILEKYFVHIGVVEDLQTSVDILARKLGFPRVKVERINTTERDEEVPLSLKEKFISRQPLEYAIYNFALKKQLEEQTKILFDPITEQFQHQSAQLQQLTSENEHLRSELNQLKNSRSWRVIAPLRHVAAALRRL